MVVSLEGGVQQLHLAVALQLDDSVLVRPVLVGLHLLVLDQLGDHHDHLDLLLDHHLPEVGEGGRQRSLAGDEGLFESFELDTARIHVVCLVGGVEEVGLQGYVVVVVGSCKRMDVRNIFAKQNFAGLPISRYRL